MKVSCLCPIIMCFCLHETAHPGNMSDDGETKPMEAESEDRPVLTSVEKFFALVIFLFMSRL